MIARDKSFYDLIAFGLGGSSSREFQAFVDRFHQLKYDVLNTDGFNWDATIQIGFTYHQLQAELGIATLPTYVDIYSPPPYKHQEGFITGENEIPRFKDGFAFGEKEIRERMALVDEIGQAALTPVVKGQMIDLLFDSIDKLLKGKNNALTYQRMQVVSTGQYSITVDNNPQGIAGLTFDFGIPAKNRSALTGANRWWTATAHTTANEGANSDPIKFMQDVVLETSERGIPLGHFEISKKLWRDVLTHQTVLRRIGSLMYPLATMDATGKTALEVSRNMLPEAIMNNIERLVGCPIIVRDHVAVVEKINKTTQKKEKVTLPGFDEKNLAYVPDGKLGTIKAVRPIRVPDPAARIAYFDGGRTVLQQTFNTKTNTQYVEIECTALTVPSVSQYMCLYTVTA